MIGMVPGEGKGQAQSCDSCSRRAHRIYFVFVL